RLKLDEPTALQGFQSNRSFPLLDFPLRDSSDFRFPSPSALLSFYLERARLTTTVECTAHGISRNLSVYNVMNNVAIGTGRIQLHRNRLRLWIIRGFREFDRVPAGVHGSLQVRSIPFQLEGDVGLPAGAWTPLAHPVAAQRVCR